MKCSRIIAVIGLGYVGLPLAVAFSKHNKVIGFDIDEIRIKELSRGVDKLNIEKDQNLKNKDLNFTSDVAKLSEADFYIVAVPTPINESREPDLTSLLNASRLIGRNLKNNDIVVYETTVYPGLTEEECLPLLEEESSLICGQDFFIGYSPERINPGDEQHTLENTIKIVSAQDADTLDIICEVYSKIIKAELYKINNIKVAEAAKVIENTQRDINIALMNELALIFNRMDIDTHDVLAAAATKWNFVNYTPGLVGGHCIGVDPYYLTHKSLRLGYSPRVILSGRSVNDSMGFYIARCVVKELVKRKEINHSTNVVILGFSFKENISDIRNTRVIDIVEELEAYDINVQVNDPHVNKSDVFDEYNLTLTEIEQLDPADAVIFAVAHDEFLKDSWQLIKTLTKQNAFVFDVKSVLPRDEKLENIELFRL